MALPTVSVLLLCFNQRRFIADCVASLARQTLEQFEVVAVDDCSTDGSQLELRQALRRLDQPSHLVLHEVNRGICASLNEALALARGRYLAITAADDLFESRKLEVQGTALDRVGPDVGFVYSDASQIDETGRALSVSFLQLHNPTFVPPASGELFFDLAGAKYCFLPIMGMLFRTDVVRAVGAFDESLVYEDWDLLLRVAERYRGVYSDYISCYRRVHPRSFSQERSEELRTSTVRLLSKWLGRSKRLDEMLLPSIERHAWWLLQFSPSQARWPLWVCFRSRPSLRALYRLACAWVPALPYRLTVAAKLRRAGELEKAAE